MERAIPDVLQGCLRHLLVESWALALMVPEVIATLADHTQGNLRSLMIMADELLGLPSRRQVAVQPVSKGGVHQASERMAELAKQVIRHLTVDDAENAGYLTFWHMEGAKCQVEKWKGRSEVLVASLIRVGVMPTVKDWSRQEIAERPKRPVQVRMSQKGGQHIKRHEYEERLGTKAD